MTELKKSDKTQEELAKESGAKLAARKNEIRGLITELKTKQSAAIEDDNQDLVVKFAGDIKTLKATKNELDIPNIVVQKLALDKGFDSCDLTTLNHMASQSGFNITDKLPTTTIKLGSVKRDTNKGTPTHDIQYRHVIMVSLVKK